MGITERKEREKQMRRGLIADAARELFFSKGLINTTMDDIAEAAELSKGTLYLYFQSKEDIQYEVCLEGANMLMNLMREADAAASNGIESLISLAGVFINFSIQEPGYFDLFIMFQGMDLNKTGIPRDRIEKYFQEESPFRVIYDAVERGKADGSIRPDLPSASTTATLWSVVLGLLTVQKYKGELYEIFDVDREEVLRINLDILLNGLKNRN